MIRASVFFWGILLGIMLIGAPIPDLAADSTSKAQEETIGRTPPRLSYIDGDVSFWRPGAEKWVDARINTALAPGDQVYVSGSGSMELQVGAEAFVRGGTNAQIELVSHEPDFLQFKVVSGQVAFDIRSIASGRAVAVATPDGEVMIDHQGYYRLDVDDQRTTLITRRNGRASVTPAGGDGFPIEPNESVVLQEGSGTGPAFQAAPGVDAWDRWNYDRTDKVLAAHSAQYVTPGTYGTADLDRYGSWRTSISYGRVWVPSGVPRGWAPYTTGSWMYDPHYGWTWVDTAPWGWAPYHYGRWVYVNHYWCWAPGPRIRRAVYAPALVAFFGRPGFRVGVSIGGPSVGWVALGWGEPLIPWWKHSHFFDRPWWGGWGGPRYINSNRIKPGRHVMARDIRHYHNSRVHNALVAVDNRHFGRGPIHHSDLHRVNVKNWRPVHRPHDVRPTSASYAPSIHAGKRPPQRRPVSAITRPPGHRGQTTRPSIRPSSPNNGDRNRVVNNRNKDELRRPSTVNRAPAVRPDDKRRPPDNRNRITPAERPRPSRVAPSRSEKSPSRPSRVAPSPPEQKPNRPSRVAPSRSEKSPSRPSRVAPSPPEQKPNRPSRVAPSPPEQKPNRPSRVAPSRSEKSPSRPSRVAPSPPEQKPNRPSRVAPSPSRKAPDPPKSSRVTSVPRTRTSSVAPDRPKSQPRVSPPSRSNSSRGSGVTVTRPSQIKRDRPAASPQRSSSRRESENNGRSRRPEQPEEDGRGRQVRSGR